MTPTIYLALPTQDGSMLKDTARAAFIHPSKTFNLVVGDRSDQGSLLGVNFNNEWATALKLAEEGEITHFAMLHSDILPEENWLGILLDEMATHGAQVLSAVVAIKDNSCDCSTAVGWPDMPWQVERLSLERTWELPETFSIDDCGEPGQVLLVNSGCMLIDLRGGWAHETDESGCLKCFFTIHDKVVRTATGTYEVRVRPEDWNFSRMAASAGCRVMATRKVFVKHRGHMNFMNKPAPVPQEV